MTDYMDTKKTTLAQTIYEGEFAKSILLDTLANVGIDPEDDANISWDYYDNSLELGKLDPAFRLNGEQQRAIHEAGFTKAYLNHTNGWETHYNWLGKRPFEPVEGWRVSYPHKRVDGTKAILVEKVVPGWPKEWFESGKCKVVEPTNE